MNFNKHLELFGKHAFLSPSTYHWLNYDAEKLSARFISAMAAKRGTELHDLAHELIRLKVRLPEIKETLNLYVNDAIDLDMSCEVALRYSPNCFGHADNIRFRDGKLNVHDLKTGVTQTSEKQLHVYAAIFCLEYDRSPFEIDIELRIYQNDEVRVYKPYPDTIAHVMDKIVTFDKQIELMKQEDERW